jgi:uncharacterized membrane protein
MTSLRTDSAADEPVGTSLQSAGAGSLQPVIRAEPERDRVCWLIAGAVFAAYLTISVTRYLRFDPSSYDLGIFTEYVRQYSRLNAPIVDARTPGLDLLGDHFHPIVALVAPFFRLFPTPVTLLVIQALLAAISVIPVARAARELVSVSAGRLIGAAYGLSWGLQGLVNNDFHEIAFAVPLLAFSLAALARSRVRAAALWALPLVFVKEDQGLTVIVIGLIIAFGYRDKARLIGLALAAWGLGWFLLSVIVIIPQLNPGHVYPYWPTGGHIGSAAPLWHQLVTGAQTKLTTLALILLPTVFLALGSPIAAVAVPSLALRFIAVTSSYWGTGWHYNATVMPIVFVAAIDAMRRIRARAAEQERPHAPRPLCLPAPTVRSADHGPPTALSAWLERHGPAMMLAICAALVFQFPLSDLWNPQTYEPGAHGAAARAAVALVPAGTTVQADISELAPLAAKDDAFWIGNSRIWSGSAGNPATRYVLFDDASGDMPPPPGSVLSYVEHLNGGVKYQMIYSSDGVSVFRRSS